jgi:hypothetical protein
MKAFQLIAEDYNTNAGSYSWIEGNITDQNSAKIVASDETYTARAENNTDDDNHEDRNEHSEDDQKTAVSNPPSDDVPKLVTEGDRKAAVSNPALPRDDIPTFVWVRHGAKGLHLAELCGSCQVPRSGKVKLRYTGNGQFDEVDQLRIEMEDI